MNPEENHQPVSRPKLVALWILWATLSFILVFFPLFYFTFRAQAWPQLGDWFEAVIAVVLLINGTWGFARSFRKRAKQGLLVSAVSSGGALAIAVVLCTSV